MATKSGRRRDNPIMKMGRKPDIWRRIGRGKERNPSWGEASSLTETILEAAERRSDLLSLEQSVSTVARERGREGGRQGGSERLREGGREAGRQEGRKVGSQGEREAGREGGREAKRERAKKERWQGRSGSQHKRQESEKQREKI